VVAAYDVLGDETKRKEYDELRAAAAARSAGRGGRRRAAGAWGAEPDGVRIHVQRPGGRPSSRPLSDSDAFYEVFDGVSLEDLLGGRSGFGSSSATSARRSRPGRDLRTTVRLNFEQAVRGATVDIPLDAQLPRSVTTRIPAGVVDGQTVRLPGRGVPSTAGGPPGDLLVQAAVEPHPLLGRDGRSLTETVPITFPRPRSVPTSRFRPSTVR
jgi:molecular chaperone DnaJ